MLSIFEQILADMFYVIDSKRESPSKDSRCLGYEPRRRACVQRTYPWNARLESGNHMIDLHLLDQLISVKECDEQRDTRLRLQNTPPVDLEYSCQTPPQSPGSSIFHPPGQ